MSHTSNHLDRGRLSLISCDSGRAFAARIETHLIEIMKAESGATGPVLRESKETWFANREVKTIIRENIRGDDCYVVQCIDDPLRRSETHPDKRRSVNDNLIALLTAVNACYQSDPDSITVVLPQYPYSRQERKKTREPITARLVAQMLEDAGADRVLTLDIHAEAIEGFFHRALLEDLHASRDILEFLKQNVPQENLCVVAPDTGGADKARFYSLKLNCAFAVVDKARDYSQSSVIESMRLVGDVDGRHVLMPDDLVGTGGTLVNACRLLKEKGARDIFVACSLPFFNGKAVEKLDRAHAEGLFQMLIGTDAVWHGPEFSMAHPWYREVSVARLFAQVLYNINHKRSVSGLLA